MNSRATLQLWWIRRVFTIAILIYVFNYTHCQSISRWVITPFGNFYDNNFQIVQATLGETIISTATDSATFYLTQGFQQPSPSELPFKEYKITIEIYPNPVITLMTIEFYVKDVNDFNIDVRDILGKMILKKKVFDVYSGQVEFIDFTGVTQGIYFIHVYSDNDEMKIVEKIVKL